MAYKLTEGKTALIKGEPLNDKLRAYVQSAILTRETKSANIIFKIYFNNKSFELENNNFNIQDAPAKGEEGQDGYVPACTDYTYYFDTPMTAEEKAIDLSVVDFLKKRAYDFINYKEQNIGSFVYADWTKD